jgi:aspartyl protease family protein
VHKVSLVLLFVCVFVGALMPSGSRKPAPPSDSTLTVDPRPPADLHEQATSVDASSGAVTLNRQMDGHFYADAQVNGTPIHFLVDTGATLISLTHEDAQRAAIPIDPSANEVVGIGAGGQLHGQVVMLDRVNLGSTELRETRATIVDGSEISLLGQSFLSQFRSVSIEGDRMVLR